MMTTKQKIHMPIGARTIKTGIAVTLSLLLSHYVPYSSPILSGVAAIICMQPSITVGIQKGLVRTQATIFGGLFGLLLHYIFGNNVLAIGIGVIAIIWMCLGLKWTDGISLASITVMAVMLQVPGNALPYTAGRIVSALIGIIVATFTNIVIAPPRHRISFQEEIHSLTELFPGLYLKLVDSYVNNKPELAQEMEEILKDVQNRISSLRQKLIHLQAGTQVPLGTVLEGIDLKVYLLFNRGVNVLGRIVAKLEDLAVVTERCNERNQELAKKRVISGSYYSSREFTALKEVLKDLTHMLGHLHVSVFQAIEEQDKFELPMINKYLDEVQKLKESSRHCLQSWEAEYIEQIDTYFLMATHRVIFDLEEIATALNDLAQTIGENIKNKS